MYVYSKTFIQFRVTAEEYRFLEKFAISLHSKEAIAKPTVSALAKSCLFSQVNSYVRALEQDYKIQEAIEATLRQ